VSGGYAERLAGRRVVVVGGTSGMGAATARAAAAAGARVVVAGRRPVAERTAGAGSGEAVGGGLEHAVVDVTDESSVRDLFAGVGTLDHLLVTATAGRPGPFREQSLAEARSFMDGKFFASWLCARHAVGHLTPGGSITFVTGGAVLRPPRHGAMIAAAFAALETLTKALAVELGPVRVNTIRPGFTDSEMWGFLSDADRATLRERVAAAMPVGRMGTPADIADAALFLMSSPQVTGTLLEVTGGEQLVPEVDLP
jgi:NAD(P)-dependent dehydrogenase (short-subunit alcohol dehydrogenase family)